MKKTIASIAIVLTLAITIPMFSAIEKWIIPVVANIDNMINITPHEIDFGTIFAQEVLNKTLIIELSESFIKREDLDDIIYSICVEKHSGGQDLTQLLIFSKYPEGDVETDSSCPGNSTLRKSTNDTSDKWVVEVEVPHIFIYADNPPVLCRDDITDQSCDDPEQDNGINKTVGLYTAKIQIDILETSLPENASQLTVIKTVINNETPPGNKTVSDFPLFINSTPVTSGVVNTIPAGFYVVSETNQSGYTASAWGGDCNPDGTITLQPSDNKTCTITNDDLPSCTNETLIPDLDIKLLLDISGSMRYSFGNGTKASVLRDAARGFIDRAPNSPFINYTTKWWIGVEEFSTTVIERIGLTPIGNQANKTSIKDAMTASSSGWTNISGVIDEGTFELNSSSRLGQPNVTSYLVLISDGEPTVGYPPCGTQNTSCLQPQAIARANAAKAQGIIIVTAGIALNNATAAFMQSLATNSSTFINVATAEDLSDFFENLLETICV